MKTKSVVAVIVGSLAVLLSVALAAQDKSTLKAANGVAFSEFQGYESWPNVAPSVTENGIKAILANPVMIRAYKDGIPGNGKPFPDGSMIVKIEWKKKQSAESPYSVEVPDTLKSVAFIEKDTRDSLTPVDGDTPSSIMTRRRARSRPSETTALSLRSAISAMRL